MSKKTSQEITDSVRIISSMQLEAIETPTTLDVPRRLLHPVTGMTSLTTLYSDIAELLETSRDLTVVYLHLPNSVIVEDRYGWEAYEAFVGLATHYLQGLGAQLSKDRGGGLVMHAFADDYVLLLPRREGDEELEAQVSDGVMRHLKAMDPEVAAVSKVYVGLETLRAFGRVHNERLVYRSIQVASARAMDIGQRETAVQARLLDSVLDADQMLMYFQPIVQASDAGIFGYEALVRCQAPELASPLVLFDIAERSGRTRKLNRALRELTLTYLDTLPPGENLFLNLHVDDFADPQVLDPPAVMRDNAERIILEVTERAAIKDVEIFRKNLETMRGYGFRIAIDDLGAGYSALNTLAEVEPDLIKFDMALIRGIDTNPVRQNLVRNMCAFAEDLEIQVVAEGVETRGEFEMVRQLGCHLVQGYYFARPAPPFVRKLEASA